MNDERLVENCLAAKSVFFGVGVFLFIHLPENWMLGRLTEPPECLSLGSWSKTYEFRWITDGFILTTLENLKERRGYALRVDTKMFQDAEKAKNHVMKKIEKIKRKSISILDKGNTSIGGHDGEFILWTKKFKSFLRRTEGEEFRAEFPVYCNGTERLIWIILKCRKQENFIRDEEYIMKILSTITCHEE
ncbi:MAG: hypothetical protein ACFFCD_15670 [Promethearchaeota archaeon]